MKQIEPHPCPCGYIFDSPDLQNKNAHFYQKKPKELQIYLTRTLDKVVAPVAVFSE